MLPTDETATEVALDLLTILGYAAIGFLAGVVISVIISIIMRQLARHQEDLGFLSRNLRLPQRLILTVFGTGMGVLIASAPTPWQAAPSWRANFEHLFLIVMIFAAAYGMTGVIRTIEDAILARKKNARETPQFRRIRTQMQVIARVLIGVVWIGATAGALLTFDQFRAIGTSLLASAGLVSLVAGLAAQSSLTNVFAGLQIAFTGSLRVGDIVVTADNQGTVEEITLTYVALRSCEERSWIVPFDLDWLVPVEAMRIELLRLVKTTDLWDGRTVALQVMDATGGSVRIRAVVSATNSGRLFELRCMLREQLINWLQTQAVYALPRTRLEPDTATAPPQEQRQDFVEQVKADWEAEQADEKEAQLLPPSESSEHHGQEENQQNSGGRLGWLRAFRRTLG